MHVWRQMTRKGYDQQKADITSKKRRRKRIYAKRRSQVNVEHCADRQIDGQIPEVRRNANADAPRTSFCLSALCNICTCCAVSFAPYLSSYLHRSASAFLRAFALRPLFCLCSQYSVSTPPLPLCLSLLRLALLALSPLRHSCWVSLGSPSFLLEFMREGSQKQREACL